jgi:Bifunctional DNA primase/polymerase, N-terminal
VDTPGNGDVCKHHRCCRITSSPANRLHNAHRAITHLQAEGRRSRENSERRESHRQPVPRTFTVATSSGGRHLYFQAPAGPVRNSASRLGPLIDVRAAGGYVIAPGSRVGGRPYEVVEKDPPILLPGWIATLLYEQPAPAAAHRPPAQDIRQPTWYAQTALRKETERVATARPGTRNDTLNRAAFSLGQLVAANLLPAGAVIIELADAAERCGLPVDEAHRTIHSGMTSGMQHRRTQRPSRTPQNI